MKWAIVVAAAVAAFSATSARAQSTTVYYQPTPFPLKKYDGTAMPQDLEKVHILDGWINNTFSSIMTFQRDDRLKLGGYGDFYRSYVNMDLAGLPSKPTNVAIWFRFFPSGATTTPFQFFIPNQSWNTTLTWAHQPTNLGCTGQLTPPTTDVWASWYITSWYQNWMSGAWGKFGVALFPQHDNNNFDFIRSSRYADFASDPAADGKRPLLQFDFTPPVGMPHFKMPLSGGARGLLSGEAGGYECKGESPWPDTTHQGSNYFALDFTPTNIKDAGGSYTGNLPILATTGGKVIAVEESNPNGNGGQGWYVTLDHGSGYLTRYLHFASHAARVTGAWLHVGDSVNQGDQIGIMGGSGGFPVHLHINFWYNNAFNGGSNVSN